MSFVQIKASRGIRDHCEFVRAFDVRRHLGTSVCRKVFGFERVASDSTYRIFSLAKKIQVECERFDIKDVQLHTRQ